MTPLSEIPPYVVFEAQAVEDREASIEAGFPKFKDVDFAIITPHGSKDRIPRVVSEWFEQREIDVKGGRFPAAWLTAYKQAYAAWKAGREVPLSGTPLSSWPGLTPAQLKNLNECNIRTVEEVAAMNEEMVSRVGMGSRALSNRARDWLETIKAVGGSAEQISALKAENADLKEQLKTLAETVRKMQPEKVK